MHYAFPSWSVNTGKCLAMDQQGLTANDYRDNFVSIQNCTSSNQVFVFDGNRYQDGSPEQQSATIKLLTDIDLCMTFKDGREHEIIFKPCEINNDKFLFQEIRQRRDQEEEAYHIRGHGEYEDLCVGSNQDYTNPNVTVRVKMVPCGGGDAFDLGFIASAESMDMDIIINPEINDFQYTSLGETFMVRTDPSHERVNDDVVRVDTFAYTHIYICICFSLSICNFHQQTHCREIQVFSYRPMNSLIQNIWYESYHIIIY